MRVSALIIASASAANHHAVSHRRVARQAPESEDRRYFQLVELMEHYNSDFDERKYWAYGCNCLILGKFRPPFTAIYRLVPIYTAWFLTVFSLGDRPMSDPGHGPPVDALDTVCKAYKDCLKCARMEHGDSCIGEFTRYRFGYTNGEPVCKNRANTCERALCECDAKFAREHVAQTGVFDEKYHMFWSTNNGGAMWDPANDNSACPRGGSGPHQPECCAPADGTGPAVLYNAATKACCNDGRVVTDASQC